MMDREFNYSQPFFVKMGFGDPGTKTDAL
jgi:hypothetical protein